MAERKQTAPEATMADPTASPLFSMSFSKGIDVLAAFGPHRPAMNLPEMAAAAGISRSSAQRFAYTLETLGFLSKDPETKRYTLTPKLLELGHRYLQMDSLVERANPYLLDLNRQVSETVNLSEPYGTDMIYVARFATHLKTGVHMPLGRRLPMFCTSSGRAWLSMLPRDQARDILAASPRPTFTATTVTDLERLMDMLDEAREQGYAYANGEYFHGDLNLAVPILDRRGQPAAALNISAPTARWTLARMKRELAPNLLETGRLISTTPPAPGAVAPFRRGYTE